MKEKKKVLLVTTVSGFIPQFEMNNVRLLQEMGYEIHYAANYKNPSYGKDNHRLDGTGIIRHQIDFVRSPFRPENLTVYRQLCRLMRQEHFSLVHCHTPMGGVMARLAAHATHTGPVVYTAHGFHFYKGASLMHWLCYYPTERLLSRYTDQQICINKEDFERAKKTFHAAYVDYIPGVGIDLTQIPELSQADIIHKKAELGIPAKKIIFMSTGELIKRKNHETALQAIAKLKRGNKNNSDNILDFHYIICGHGKLEDQLNKLVRDLGIEDMVTFLGYREDILQIYQIADVFLFPSFQEGLPIALLEAMASGLPVICSDIRGNQDLMGEPLSVSGNMEFCQGGIMINGAGCVDAYCQAISYLCGSPQRREHYGNANQLLSQDFSIKNVTDKMQAIYLRLLNGPTQ